jgi:hypothetical protein
MHRAAAMTLNSSCLAVSLPMADGLFEALMARKMPTFVNMKR